MGAEDYDVVVSGGAHSTSAEYADMAWVANRALELADDLHAVALAISSLSYDSALTATADLAPETYQRVQDAFDDALHEPGGMFAVEAAMEARSTDLGTAVANYQAGDEYMAALMSSAWTWFQGASQFNTLRLAYILDMYEQHGEQWLVEHPGILQDFLASAPASATGLPLSVTQVAGALSTLWVDGEGFIRQQAASELDDIDAASQVPTSLGNVMTALADRNTAASTDTDLIDVRIVTQADGTVAYIVDIPGTADWNLPSTTANPNPNDLTTNIEAMGEASTARQDAIAQALARAGASSTSPVMLVGHSQGGILAAQAAADTVDGTFDYNVTHIVTAGSPISAADIPPGVQVLALENNGDIVPTLDGADNPQSSNVTTVSFDNQTGTIGGNHELGGSNGSGHENYVAVAETLDDSDDPAIQAYLESASDFIVTDPTGTTVTVEGYVLSRG